MICKDEAEMLKKTLPSLSQRVDELIVLLDSRTSDNSRQVAEQFGAKVFDFNWSADFSAARNASLQHSSGEWILWIDADELLLLEDLDTLRATISRADEVSAYTLTLYETSPDKCEEKQGFQRTKLFKNGLGYHFERPVNEQLVDEKGTVIFGKAVDVPIYHFGRHLAEEKMKLKRQQYVDVYTSALEKTPSDPYLHFLLANNLGELQRLPEALEHYQAAGSFVPALAKKAEVLLRLKRLPEAAQAAADLLKVDSQNILARNTLSSIYLIAGKVDLAIEMLTETLRIKTGEEGINLYQSEAMPNFLLGQAFKIKGEKEKAAQCFSKWSKINGS
jgi:glycosyltransferase involved in cell wall biosynthesis